LLYWENPNINYKSKTHFSLKKIYEKLKKNNFIKPKIEQQFTRFADEWPKIYKNIHNKKLDSNLRSFNYKFLFDSLPTSDKYKNKIKCCFCKKEVEKLNHIYQDCEIIKNLFSCLFSNKTINFDELRFMLNINKYENIKYSKFKFIVWKIRNIFKLKQANNVETSCIVKLYKKLETKYD
jgi:hypothetical protein